MHDVIWSGHIVWQLELHPRDKAVTHHVRRGERVDGRLLITCARIGYQQRSTVTSSSPFYTEIILVPFTHTRPQQDVLV